MDDNLLTAQSYNTSSTNQILYVQLFIIISFLTLLMFSVSDLHAQDIETGDNGNWHTGNTWLNNTIPAAGNNVIINHVVTISTGSTAEVGDLTINPSGTLVVEGTLIVNGNLKMNFSGNNESELEMLSNSVVLVRGNVHLTNKVKLNLSSYFIVMGDLTKDGAAVQGDIVVNDASIYVFGTISVNTGLILCSEYNGITHTNTENCHAGNDSDFENNSADGTIPVDIVNLVLDVSEKTIDVSVVLPAATCNAANGEINFSETNVTTEVAFVVEMETGNPSFNPEWEFSFTLTSTTGAAIDNVSDGTKTLTAISGAYVLTGLQSSGGAGSVVIYLEVTGGLYNAEDVVLTITSAKEPEYNKPDVDSDDWTAVQIVNPVPQTSVISTD